MCVYTHLRSTAVYLVAKYVLYRVCVCVCVRERERVCVCVYLVAKYRVPGTG